MLCHLTTEKTVLSRAITFTFRHTQKTCQFSTSRSHSTSSEESPKQPSKGRNILFFNWLAELKSPLKVVSLAKKSPKPDSCEISFPPLFTPSYEPESSSSLRLLDELNEVDLPGRYLALDCEMVGVGIHAKSSLGRVSVVNYYGTVILDEYVKPRDRVVDYRTPWSGIRASDLVNAKPFEEVQKSVVDLLNGRILIGHALDQDLKVLLFSHPTEHTRDTQIYAYKFALSAFPKISLKRLARQELGVNIQTGEHSSVEDAKATMAIYRLHKSDWEKASRTTISNIRAPEPIGLRNLDEGFLLNTIHKRRQLAMRLGIDIKTGGNSSVVDTKATGVHRLPKKDVGRAIGSVSQMREPVLRKMGLEPPTFERREAAQPELVNVIQTGERSSVDVGRASGSISQMRGHKTKVLWKTDLEPPTVKRTKVAQRDLGNDIQLILDDAKAAMGIYRLHKNDIGRASKPTPQMRGPKTTVLGKTDLEPPTIKRTKVAQQNLGNDIKSIVENAKASLAMYRLHKNDVGRASGSISEMQGPVLRKMYLEPPTFERREAAQQELVNDIQTGERSSVTDVLTSSKERKVANRELGIQVGEHLSISQERISMPDLEGGQEKEQRNIALHKSS